MMFKTLREVRFWNDATLEYDSIPKGSIIQALTKADLYRMEKPGEYIRAKKLYEKRGINGVFLLAKNKYRWFNACDISQC